MHLMNMLSLLKLPNLSHRAAASLLDTDYREMIGPNRLALNTPPCSMTPLSVKFRCTRGVKGTLSARKVMMEEKIFGFHSVTNLRLAEGSFPPESEKKTTIGP